MKKLIIKEIPDKQGIVTKIKVSEQSHRNKEFGNEIHQDFEQVLCFKHNGFALISDGCISACEYPLETFESADGLFVRGNTKQHDDEIISVPSQEWLERMRAAVDAYNKHFANCDGCIERNCNTCIMSVKDMIK